MKKIERVDEKFESQLKGRKIWIQSKNSNLFEPININFFDQYYLKLLAKTGNDLINFLQVVKFWLQI